MRSSLPAIVAGLALLLPIAGAAQVSKGVAPSPGVTFQPRSDVPRPEPAPPRDASPGRHGDRGGSTGGDLFLADRHTYAPRYDRRVPARHQHRRLPFGALPYFVPLAEPLAPIPASAPPGISNVNAGILQLRIEPSFVSSAAPTANATAPATPKTLYVIPRCYAGDRKPDSALLLPGCDPARMRVIPAGQ
jgi:hypothetical protein